METLMRRLTGRSQKLSMSPVFLGVAWNQRYEDLGLVAPENAKDTG